MTEGITTSLEDFLFAFQYKINSAFLMAGPFDLDTRIYSEKELEEKKLSRQGIIEMIQYIDRENTSIYFFCWRNYICFIDIISDKVFKIAFRATEDVEEWLVKLIIDIPRLMYQLYKSYDPIFIRTEFQYLEDNEFFEEELENNMICGLDQMQLFKKTYAAPDLLHEINYIKRALKIEKNGTIFIMKPAYVFTGNLKELLKSIEYPLEVKI